MTSGQRPVVMIMGQGKAVVSLAGQFKNVMRDIIETKWYLGES